MKGLIIVLMALVTFTALAQPKLLSQTDLNNLVFQQGEDKNAVWGYVGFLPRVEDPNRITIFSSKKGLTMRVRMILTRNEVEDYAAFLVNKSEQIEEVRKGDMKIRQADGTYSTPFEVLDVKTYERFQQAIAEKVNPVVNAGYEANLELLKSFFGENVTSSDSDKVVFDMVFPISMQKASWTNFAWTKAEPRAGVYNAHTIENRRTFHSPDASYIFAGFPAFWFNGGIGFHGPIAYTTNSSMIAGLDLPESERADKKVSKRWQLLRAPVSAGCMRMEHTNELRSMLPSNVTKAMKVTIQILDDYDTIQTAEGTKVVGVKYYWYDVSKKADEKAWKNIFYAGKAPTNLKEYPYYQPQIIQLKPLLGSANSLNPNATADNLMRLPLAQ
mgnify:CR=1 FL=1